MVWKICSMLILIVFYGIYFGKMPAQKKRGIITDQIAKGKRRDKVYYTELVMKIATISAVAAEVISIIWGQSLLPSALRAVGLIIGFAGVFIFGTAVWTMKDSWRAGLAEGDETKMITSGIYKYSRNPAFLGFDMVYIGILLVYFNAVLAVLSLWAAVMLHLQIKQEEKYLQTVFGEPYNEYCRQVSRYLGK